MKPMDSTPEVSKSGKRLLVLEELHRHFPKHTHDEVVEALEDCRKELGNDPGHDAVVRCIQSRLTPQAGDGVD